jgi:hypothetical protein
MAYAQAKLRKYNQSKDTIQKLLKTYEKSIWKEDAELLLAQLPGAPVPARVDALTQTPEPNVLISPLFPAHLWRFSRRDLVPLLSRFPLRHRIQFGLRRCRSELPNHRREQWNEIVKPRNEWQRKWPTPRRR